MNQKNTVFLVDDQKITNFIHKKLFEITKLPCRVLDFTDPTLALSKITEYQPQLILLDLQMPKIDGWEFLEHVKKMEHQPKIIIVTSSESHLDKSRSVNYSQVIDYKVKPLMKKEVLSFADYLHPTS